MISLQSNQHAFFTGRSQSGKTSLLRRFINKFPRVVVHDRKHEWKPFAKQNHYYVVGTPRDLHRLLQKGAKRVVYQPVSPEAADFNDVCKIIYDLGNITFVIDETASYCPTGSVPYYCGELLRLGSGRGIGVISLTQRPRKVDNVLLSESTVVVSFKLNLQTDRTKLAETCGKIVDPSLPEDPVERAKVRSLATLRKYHFMVFDTNNDDTVTWHTPIPIKAKDKIA